MRLDGKIAIVTGAASGIGAATAEAMAASGADLALIDINEKDNQITVKDNKCPLCKYKFEDINVAGCEILIAIVSEMVTLISKESKDKDSLFLEALEVKESKALGQNVCTQVYKYKIGGN